MAVTTQTLSQYKRQERKITALNAVDLPFLTYQESSQQAMHSAVSLKSNNHFC